MKAKKFDVEKLIRACCAGFQPYVAGKPVETIQRELGLQKVIKLASNENPLGPSRRALAVIRNMAGQVYFYPDSNAWTLRQTLARKFRVAPECIILGSGSDEIIELVAKAFFHPSDEIIVSEHAFIRYKMAGDLMGSSVITVPMKGFTHNLSAMAAAITPATKAIFIANPNNPTGTYVPRKEFEAFLRRVAGSFRSCPLVIMDEAYYEYARAEKGYPETLNYLSRYPNLIILRTFSKIYGLAGLRVGYGFASAGIVDYLDRIRPPFNVSSVAQAAAVASLKDQTQVKRGVRLVRAQKELLYRALKRLGLPFVPSAANFILINVSPRTGQEVFRALLKQGVIVRAMDEYDFPRHIRVTIGIPEENKTFIGGMTKIIAGREATAQ